MKIAGSSWSMCILHLPGHNGADRVRQWRSFKCKGAAVLRDGVYLLPHDESANAFFSAQARAVRSGGGQAWVLRLDDLGADQDAAFRGLFDRKEAYAQLAEAARKSIAESVAWTTAQLRRTVARLSKQLAAVDASNFFGSAELTRLEVERSIATLAARLAQGEPSAARGTIELRETRAYQGRTWITRAGLWVDRAASAWLIRRFVDPKARFLWLKNVRRRPKDSLGFDFDGAEFTHVGAKVSFEVIAASFGLDRDRALARIGELVHALDIGSSAPPAAAGFEAVMHGARARCGSDDDRLLAEVTPTLDCLYAAYSKGQTSSGKRRA